MCNKIVLRKKKNYNTLVHTVRFTTHDVSKNRLIWTLREQKKNITIVYLESNRTNTSEDYVCKLTAERELFIDLYLDASMSKVLYFLFACE